MLILNAKRPKRTRSRESRETVDRRMTAEDFGGWTLQLSEGSLRGEPNDRQIRNEEEEI